MLAVLLVLLAPEATIEAERLEAQADRVLAEGAVRLRVGGYELRAPRAEGRRSDACPRGAFTVDGPLRLDGPRALRAEAASAEVCLPDGRLTARGLRLAAPRLRVSADVARLEGATAEAEGVVATACGCDDPPWTVSASSASVTAGEGAWATWPVLWAGPVPVAAAPAWYVPLSRRRTGFLLPRLGWDGEDGFHAQAPFFWALHQSVDLTLAPGWRMARGAFGDARLRWVATEHEGGVAETRFVATEGATVAADGTLPFGPARLALEGTVATDREVYRALHPGLALRARDHLAGVATLALAGPGVALGVRGALLQDLRQGDLPLQPGVRMAAPEAFLDWVGRWGPGTLTVDARYGRYAAADAAALDRLALAVEGDADLWVGPLRLRPVAGAASVAWLDEGQRLSAFGGGEIELALARRYAAGRHGLHFIVDGRAALAESSGSSAAAAQPLRAALQTAPGAPPVLGHDDRPFASRAVGLTLSNRLVTRDAVHRLDVRGGYEGARPVEGLDDPVVRARADLPWFALDAGAALPGALWTTTEAGPVDGLRLRAGLTRLDLERASPWLRTHGPTPARLLATDAGDLFTVDGGLGAPIGPLRFDYGFVVDAEVGELLGQGGRLTWAGRCDCWHARLNVNHEKGRDAPDVWLTVGLTPP